MNITIVANVNQLPSGKMLMIHSHDQAAALRELEAIAKKRGVEITQVYQFGKVSYYAAIETAGTREVW